MEGLNDYLRRNGIVFVDEIRIDNSDYNEENIKNHLRNIRDFNEILKGYKGPEHRCYKNEVGRYVEDMKIYYKRQNRLIKSLENKKEEELNDVEKYILKNKETIKNKVERIFNSISFEDYLSIIKRSMDDDEVSIGDLSLKNIRKNDNTFEIISVRTPRITFKEMNLVRLILRLKRNEKRLKFKEIISEFAVDNDLCQMNIDFMYSLICFPYEYLRGVNSYYVKRQGLLDTEYLDKICGAFERDKTLLEEY